MSRSQMAETASDHAAEDEELKCQDCGQRFVFGPEERRFYTNRGFKEPIYCLDCRARRRAERNADLIRAHETQTTQRNWVEALGHYGGGSNGAKGEHVRKVATYPAVCASCGRETSVPFIPRTGRPVYCTSCYSARRNR